MRVETQVKVLKRGGTQRERRWETQFGMVAFENEGLETRESHLDLRKRLSQLKVHESASIGWIEERGGLVDLVVKNLEKEILRKGAALGMEGGVKSEGVEDWLTPNQRLLPVEYLVVQLKSGVL